MATRESGVQSIRVIVHVGPGWTAPRRRSVGQAADTDPSMERSDVRSAKRDRPCTGTRTSAHKTAKKASTGDAHASPKSAPESRGKDGAKGNVGEITLP